MTHSPYDRPDLAGSPDYEQEPEVPIQERDQPWFESLTEEQYKYYRQEAWSVAYVFLGQRYVAEEIADAVIGELYQIQKPFSHSQIEAYLRQRAKWRAIDQLRSVHYHHWKHQLPLWRTTEDGEEQEVVPKQLIVDGAEETLLQQLEASEMDELTERRLAHLHQAILRIKDGERRACFVLRHTYDMKPAAIANELNIPIQKVYVHLRLALTQVRGFMQKLEKQDAKKQKKKLPP